MVVAAHSGSKTQEVFYLYIQHCIASLPADSGSVILMLDGDGS
jgi:hypothetical protein